MRVWHIDLIPYLCSTHLVACWREALGAYSIITEGKTGYANHPQTKQYAECPEALHDVLMALKQEADKRGYHFKDVPERVEFGGTEKPWQTLEEQVEWLKTKGCKCSEALNGG